MNIHIHTYIYISIYICIQYLRYSSRINYQEKKKADKEAKKADEADKKEAVKTRFANGFI